MTFLPVSCAFAIPKDTLVARPLRPAAVRLSIFRLFFKHILPIHMTTPLGKNGTTRQSRREILRALADEIRTLSCAPDRRILKANRNRAYHEGAARAPLGVWSAIAKLRTADEF